LFLIITVLGIRGWLANSISPSLKHSFAVGIGLFLAFIGLAETGIVKSYAVGKPPVAFFPPGSGVPTAAMIDGSKTSTSIEI